MPAPELPVGVAALLGPDPEGRPGEGASRVVAGRGLVAKVGPPAVIEREAWMLRRPGLPLAVPELVGEGPGWLVVREVADVGGDWSEIELHAALGDLAALHRAFRDAVPAGPLR